MRQFAHKDDTSRNVYFGGRLGAAYKELTCKFGLMKIRREARKPGSMPWIKGGPRPEQLVSDARTAARQYASRTVRPWAGL
ncbi:hypothetical protein [Amycolatopsis taiwanensis]|uniref:hypothetical protein n=1 Tax=Amycolatopsis taiwanensis TaxID=342230 RepID=UPI0004AD6292|nr:hypothetical protein [Amycolatopsis taiwanensis]